MSDHLPLRMLMAERGGVASWTELAAGVGRSALETGCRDGVVVRTARGVYVCPGLDLHLVARAASGGILSHLSAAVRHGWSLKVAPKAVYLTLRPNARTPVATAGRRFFYRKLSTHQIVDHVTEPLRTVLDCARDLPFDEALTVADSALRAGDITVDELQEAAETIAGAGAVRARRVLRETNGSAANPLESVLRALCCDVPGLAVVPQLPIQTHSCGATVDLADPRLRVVIEAEGFETHGTRRGFDSDCARYTALVCDDWLVVRFTWTQVMHRPSGVLEQLKLILQVRSKQRAHRRSGGAKTRIARSTSA